ncbi:MAG: cadherin-like beta sandwich domain-containing protein [Ruminococcus sp.]|nr:cadherin-like beta sandwich domain-containing protein [Ruminococcus sp.]
MKCHRGKNIFYYIVSILIFMLSFFSVNINVSAATHKFDFDIVKCPVANENDIFSSYDDCLNNYKDGNAYIYKDGETIEPGTYALMVLKFVFGGNKDALAFNANAVIDTKYWEFANDADGYFYEMEIAKEDFPSAVVNRRTVYPWNNYSSNIDEETLDTYIVRCKDSQAVAPLDGDYDIGYILIHLKEDAKAGDITTLYFDNRSSLGNEDMNVIASEKGKINLAVAGGTISGDNTLKTLTVKGNNITYPLSPNFVPATKPTDEGYQVIVPNSVTSIDISATTNDEDATIASINKVVGETVTAGDKSLTVGNNKFTIIVSALNGDQTTYTINVKRLNNDADLTGINFTNGISISGFNKDTLTYDINDVPFATKSTTVTPLLSDSNATIDSGDGLWNLTNAGNTANTRTITVKAENCKYTTTDVPGNTCTTKTYTVNLKRVEASNNSKLSSLTVDGVSVPDFRPEETEYTLNDVANNKNSVLIGATVSDTSKATIESGTGNKTLGVGDNALKVVVKAEDNTTTTYTINIRRKNNDATLSSLTISSNPQGTFSPDFSSTFFGDYTYSYGADVTSVNVTATVTDTEKATVSLTDTSSGATGTTGTSSTASATYGTNTTSAVALVTAEDGTVKTYSIKFSRAKSSNNYLKSLTVAGTSVPSFNKEKTSYNVTVAANITSVEVLGVPEDELNSNVISGNGSHTLNFGNNDIEVIVQAENGQKLSYYIHVNRKESDDATLKSLTVDGVSVPNFDPDTITYTLPEVEYSKTSVNIAASTTDDNARVISGTGNISLSTGNNALKVVVNAQDGTPKTYTINIPRKKNTDTSATVTIKGIPASLNSEGKYEVTLDNSVSVLTPSDVVINLGAGATVSKPTTNTNLNTGVNSYTFTVTAEDTTEVKTYEVLITREESSENSISTVTLTLGDNTTRTCTMSGTSCTIEVPSNTTGFNLSATIPNTATISPLNGTYHTMGTSESTKAIPLTVTAENGNEKVYTVNVTRQKSSNNDLSDLTVDGVTVKDFLSSTQTYRITVPGTTTEVTIGATVADTGKATITTDLSNPFKLNFGSGNDINIVVRAENGQTKTYTINVTRETGVDATLKDLTINGTTISDFSPSTKDYTLDNVDYNTTGINVGATPNDSNAKATGTGLISLKTGDNAIIITVTAHDGITKGYYTVHVNRAKNRDTGIKGVTVAGKSATLVSVNTYEVTVPNNITFADSSNVSVDVNDPLVSTDPKATYSIVRTDLVTDNVNNVTFVVTSEDGNSTTYNINVTREKSKIATLESLIVTPGGSFSPSFNKGTLSYTVTVPENTTFFKVIPTKTDPKSTITSGDNVTYDMTSSSMTVNVVVVSEDESVTTTYALNIERVKSTVNTLSSITVSHNGTTYELDPEFKEEEITYTVNVPGDVDNVDIAAVLKDEKAEIESGTGNHTLNVGNNPVTIRVRSESGSPFVYNLNIIRAPKSDAKLTDLTIDGETIPGFDPEILEYTISTPYPNSTSSVTIGATKSDEDATVTGIGSKTLETGENTIEVKVKAQDGTERTYKIILTKEKSDNNYLSILSINGGISLKPAFDKETLDYEITVSETKTEFGPTDLTALPEVKTATVSKGNAIPLTANKDNIYSITVTAENGTNKVYNIKVIRPESTDATLKDVILKGASLSPGFNPALEEYTLNVPYGATSFEIEGIPNVDTTDVDGNGTYNVADNSSITLVTLAEAGMPHTKTYTFNIVEALSNDATLTSLSIPGYPLDKNFASGTTTYNIGNIPYGTTELLINAIPTNASSTLEYLVGSNTQSSNRVSIPQAMGNNTITINVTAPDGITTKPYIISYNMILSDNAYLKKLEPSVGSISFNKTTYEYEINVDDKTDSISFDIETEDANAGIEVDGESFATPKTITLSDLKTGNNLLSILVRAQNSTATHTYNVVIKKAAPVASNDATLSSLSVEDHQFAPNFDPETEEYTIGTIPYDLERLTIHATPNVEGSIIKYLVNGVAQTGNVVNIPKANGVGTVVVQVTAEDGTTVKNYNIKYTKTASDNAYLRDITLSEGTIEFDKTKLEYKVDVGENVNSIDITAFAEDTKATITVDGKDFTSPHTSTISPLHDGANTLVIKVTAEDGETVLNYKVIVNKNTSTPPDIPDKITSVEYGHNIDDDYILTVTPGTTGLDLKNQLDNDNEYLEIWDKEDQNKISDSDNVTTGMMIRLVINGQETDSKVIVILGDTNGDGKITTNDNVKVSNHILNIVYLNGAYLKAADTNKDDKITTNDNVKISNHILKIVELFK